MMYTRDTTKFGSMDKPRTGGTLYKYQGWTELR